MIWPTEMGEFWHGDTSMIWAEGQPRDLQKL